MIHIVLRFRTDALEEIEVSGHAGYAPSGQDIVCAGVSALLGGALNALDHYQHGRFSYRIDPQGAATIRLGDAMTEEGRQQAQIIMKTFQLGVDMLRQDYPGYLVIHEEEVD